MYISSQSCLLSSLLLGSHRWTNLVKTIDSELGMPNRAWPVHVQVKSYGNPGDKPL